MTIVLNHTIVPARDKEASAKFFARIFGLKYEGPMSHFAPVRVNDGLTFDFDTDTSFESHHYAFMVSDAEFDAIFGRIKEDRVAYGNLPSSPDNMTVNEARGGKRIYFRDPAGHLLEIMTR
jgi:catechol 2,3-dioxygenase-like lactoylglutathione lyase family enzyme